MGAAGLTLDADVEVDDRSMYRGSCIFESNVMIRCILILLSMLATTEASPEHAACEDALPKLWPGAEIT